jgi:protein-L-isoaspartate(D-aspartate) O-methyltransferase
VVPLRMRGNSRCLTLRQHGDHLVATATILCGFVPMQGDGSDPMWRYQLRGEAIVMAVDDTSDVDHDRLGQAFDHARVDGWAPVTVGAQESFESLHLWLASPSRPFGLLAVNRDRTEGLLDPQNKASCPTYYTSDSLAYLAIRKVDDTTWQFGAHGFGPDAPALTQDMVQLITVWDREYRHDGGPDITVHPAGSTLPDTDRPRLLVPRRHTVTAITWPARR